MCPEPSDRPSRRSVVVGYDVRWQSDGLLLLAAAEAERRHARLAVVTVQLPEDDQGGSHAQAARRLAAAGDAFQQAAPRVPVDTYALLAAELSDQVEPFASADLLVIGSRGLDHRLPFGPESASSRLLSATTCPVLAVPDEALGEAPLGQGRIVAGLSGDAWDLGVAEAAAFEAAARDAGLEFLHAFSRRDDQHMSRTVTEAIGRISSLLPADPRTDGPVSVTLTRDSPVIALARAAQGARLVVVGSRPAALEGAVLGSVSRGVLSASTSPVLVVRTAVMALRDHRRQTSGPKTLQP